VTKRRDSAAEQVFIEDYPNIDIAGKVNFYHHDNAYDACKKLMKTYPEIVGLYVSWQLPALGAIRALRDLGRKDVLISTVDLDYEIATYLAKNEYICGISAQKPYDEGTAAAYATVSALLGKEAYKYVGLRPITVVQGNLSKTWVDIMHSELPDFIQK
jgi:ribose transport system substrate-binding protein